MKTEISFPLERILTTTDVGSFCRSKDIDPSNYDQIGVHSEVDSPLKDVVARQITYHFILKIPRQETPSMCWATRLILYLER